jgi:ribosome biogenesis GTPase / thiamine phosphate phosphatase
MARCRRQFFTFHVSRFTFHVSRFTFHVSKIGVQALSRNVPDYDEYDEHYADDYFETRGRSKPKTKKQESNLIPGVVIRSLGHHYEVESEDGVRLCRVRGRLLQERQDDTLVAVGDRVFIVPEGKKKGLIDQVQERESVLSRRRPGASRAVEDVILANPDQALIVFAVAQPEPHLRMLDRFLVIAEANELPAIICVNKVDLLGVDAARAKFSFYESLGYPLIYASAQTGEGIDELSHLLEDSLTVVTGPSGVGKSTLINAIHPDLNLRVGDLRDFEGKGRHTTRSAQLFHLPFGKETYIADTPGIRELGLYEIDPASLGFYFVDIKPFVNDCRYPNCTHTHEPDCAVQAAVQEGNIAPERYESYLRILEGEDLQDEEW